MPGKRNGRTDVKITKETARQAEARRASDQADNVHVRPGCLAGKANANSIPAAGTASNSRGIALLTRLSRDSSRKQAQPRALCVRSRLSRSCPAVRSKLSGEPRPGGRQRRFQRCGRPTGRARSSRCSRKDHVAPSADGHAHMPALRHACMPGSPSAVLRTWVPCRETNNGPSRAADKPPATHAATFRPKRIPPPQVRRQDEAASTASERKKLLPGSIPVH